jgi:pyruvate formate lyase activating enzyme
MYTEYLSPEGLVSKAKSTGCIGVSFTFNEPVLWFEYTVDAAKLSRAQGLYTNYVTNGFITEEAFDMVAPFLDAYRVDIKGFTEETYTRIGHIKEFKGILEITKKAKEYGVHVEVVTNIIPGFNDSETELRRIGSWVKNNLGPEVPWHVTRFYPHHELTHLSPMPISKLERAWSIGKEEGLWYVYLGNVPGHGGENTYCHMCSKLLTERYVFDIIKSRIVGNRCPKCNAIIPGMFPRKG